MGVCRILPESLPVPMIEDNHRGEEKDPRPAQERVSDPHPGSLPGEVGGTETEDGPAVHGSGAAGAGRLPDGERDKAAGFVYLIGVVDGCHKIGESTDPDRRLNQFPSMPSQPRVVVRIATADRRWLERCLHLAFRDRHVGGEWFRLAPADVETLTAVGRVDSESDLPPSIVADMQRNEVKKKKTKLPGGRGRPPMDPSGTGKRVTVSLNPAEIAHLEATYGTAYRGLRTLIRKDVAKHAAAI